MSAEAALVHTWRVGRWTVTLSMPPLALGGVRHAVCEWEPCVPGRPLTESERREYDAGLSAAMEIAASQHVLSGAKSEQ